MELTASETTRSSSGAIRAARRPPGWRAPGPPPATPADAARLGPRSGEDLCFLTGDWRIFQKLDGHRWSLDDLVTAWLAAREMARTPPRRVADLGCGIGSVLLMTAWRFPAAVCVGVEAQDMSADLARRSIAWNGTVERVAVHAGDFRDEGALAGEPPFDLVTGTPPYFRVGEGVESRRPQFGPCHFEHRGGLEEYCRKAAGIMAPDGAFVLCAGAGQDERMSRAARDSGLRVTRRLSVVPREGKDALFAVYALRRASRSQSLCDEPALVVRDRDGRRTRRFVALRADMGMPP
jgi:tRNA1(Val) A37 N6-methylase TrmN6